ncbi:MAG: fumarylacetoacetate hydrolase family protein [Eubacteriales bacterium]|nr:fumarylacetoacetate hydrolase family protein [Eubacteriales bacterium]
MKLMTYKFENEEKIGVLKEDKVFEIINYQSMNDVILGKESIIESENGIDLSKVKMLAPIPTPARNIFCLGRNYAAHVKEMGNRIANLSDMPSDPIYFAKITNGIVGDKMDVESHFEISKSLDYEVELAVIIGKKGKNISKEEAKDYIFGYAVANDFSMRDLQKERFQWMKGKGLDTHMALGPVILTVEEVAYPPALDMKLYVNDELRQSSNTDQLFFDIDHIICDLSNGTTLFPGDIILTGTPGGVGMGFTPPIFLVAGDIVKCEIEQIGELVNYIK